MGKRYKEDSQLLEIGNRIRELRKKTKRSDGKAMNQEEFYKYLDCGPSRTGNTNQGRESAIENGQQPPTPAELVAIAQKCNVTTDWILTGEKCIKSVSDTTETRKEITLADILNAILLIYENHLFNIRLDNNSAALVTAASISTIKKHYCFLSEEGGYTDKIDYSENSISKLYLYSFLTTLGKLVSSLHEMDSDLKVDLYNSWKKQTLEAAANYDLHGDIHSPFDTPVETIEKMKTAMEYMLNPYNMYPDEMLLPIPSDLKSFFDIVKVQKPQNPLQKFPFI